ncbi:DUF222 domain-containing protein [Nocardioides zeae]|uniref:DUF222 domain-containing protein n=1 Tax=Nocardioides imazamoxiresistens TaxID=3231893 RepID=A0ABU3PZA0_9ACTN|nr:DUF222 domain-containing protein [Nocardioides zeae]MDT9594598.1 DUF222 domain-containing protein [Nocardioides zeae]
MDRGTQQHTNSPSRAALLDAASEAMRAQRAAEAGAFFAAADYADAHLDVECGSSIVGDPIGALGMWVEENDLPAVPGGDRWLAYGGPGAPLVSEFAVLELVTAMGLSQDAGRSLVGDAVEVRHRLPLLAGRVAAGGVQVWRARRIARATRTLTFEGAGFVDRNLAHVAHSISGAGIDRLVAEASARFDPETTEADLADADAGRFFSIDFRAREALGVHGQVGGTVAVAGELDLADARDLEEAVARGAAELAALGSGESLDVRRSIAVGELARKQTALDLTGHDGHDGPVAASTVAARQVVLYVHLSQSALESTSIGIDPLTGGTGIDLATVTAPGVGLRTVTAEQVRDWCRTTDTQVVVKPVIDLNEHITTPSYRIPDRLVEQVQLRYPTCRFPYCNRPARVSDLDHRVEWHSGGPTASDNLVPLCRLHHRAKTHPTHAGTDPPDGPDHEQHHERRWRYRPTRPDEPPDGFVWTSPRGRRYLVTPTGTTALE